MSDLIRVVIKTSNQEIEIPVDKLVEIKGAKKNFIYFDEGCDGTYRLTISKTESSLLNVIDKNKENIFKDKLYFNQEKIKELDSLLEEYREIKDIDLLRTEIIKKII